MDNHIHSVAGRDLSSCGPAVKAALMLTGFSAVIGQIVLMRELMVVFSGNEISLGIMLATWLFWTAAGSILCGSLACAKVARVKWWLCSNVCSVSACRLRSGHCAPARAFFRPCQASWLGRSRFCLHRWFV
jgi:hypothetical protein